MATDAASKRRAMRDAEDSTASELASDAKGHLTRVDRSCRRRRCYCCCIVQSALDHSDVRHTRSQLGQQTRVPARLSSPTVACVRKLLFAKFVCTSAFIRNHSVCPGMQPNHSIGCEKVNVSVPEYICTARGRWNRETWQRGTKLNRSQQVEYPSAQKTNVLNDKRIKSCLSRFDSGAYSRLQFLRAVSHSVGAHTESLQPRVDEGVNLDPTDKVFFFADSGSPGGPNWESSWWHRVTFGHFE